MLVLFLIAGPFPQQYRPSLQYQSQLNYRNFLTTKNSLVGSSQTGYVYNRSFNQLYKVEDSQEQTPSSNYSNSNYVNFTNQQYQPYIVNYPYCNQPSSNYPRNAVISQSQNFPTKYFSAGHFQQPVKSSSEYGQLTNEMSLCTTSGYTPQISYGSFHTTQSAISSNYGHVSNQLLPCTNSSYDNVKNQLLSYTSSG